jgi:hypothetical protein
MRRTCMFNICHLRLPFNPWSLLLQYILLLLSSIHSSLVAASNHLCCFTVVLFAFNARSNPYLAGTLVTLIWLQKRLLKHRLMFRILFTYWMTSRWPLRNYHQCRIHLADFLSLCKYLGVPIREFSFARIELDTLCITALFITWGSDCGI